MSDPLAKKLAAARTAVARIEAALTNKRNRVLKQLHLEHGFTSPDAFIKALQQAAATAGPGSEKVGVRRRKRTAITPKIKKLVKELAMAGRTGAEIVHAVGISLPSVQNIKRELGLTRVRKK